MTGGLAGRWRVERTSGLLPPFGLRKRIGRDGGWTALGPIPLAPFRVRGRTLDYAVWPVKDELVEQEGGDWVGRGLIFGREFCRFRLVRDPQGSWAGLWGRPLYAARGALAGAHQELLVALADDPEESAVECLAALRSNAAPSGVRWTPCFVSPPPSVESRPRGGKTPDETCSQAVEQRTLMPDFGAMEEQANARAHYLEALANRDTSEP